MPNATAVAQALRYRSDPADTARWRRSGSVLSINRFMFYDHLRAEGGAGDALVELCGDFGLVHADRRGNPVFVRRNAAGKPVGIETLTAAQQPDPRGGFWMSWEPDWPASVILAGNALDDLSILSLHLVPAMRKGCAVVSTGTASIPKWIQAWNPSRIFCARDSTPNGDHHAQRLQDKDTRVVRLRPALDGQDWNDMLIRERAGEPLGTDGRPID